MTPLFINDGQAPCWCKRPVFKVLNTVQPFPRLWALRLVCTNGHYRREV